MKVKDVSLSNVDLTNWCEYLGIPIKGIFSRNETKHLHHSPYIINMDDFGNLGTHWVCCWSGKKDMEYFDSFGLHPPLEWEHEMWKLAKKTFLRNDNQIQAIDSRGKTRRLLKNRVVLIQVIIKME